MSLTFDEKRHAYYLDGVRLPSVTQVIDDLQIGPIYPPGDYRVRGQQVHRATHLYDIGEIENYEIGATILPYLESYIQVLDTWPFIWANYERQMADFDFLVAGTEDRDGTLFGEPVSVDLKSGKPGREVGLQLAGYTRMAFPKDYRKVRRFKIELHSDGSKGNVVEYSDPFDHEGWAAAVALYKWKRRKAV